MKFLHIFLLLIVFVFSDEFADEFDDIEIIKTEKIKKEDKNLEIDSEIYFNTSYNYKHNEPKNKNLNDFRGLSSLDIALNTKIKYKINKNYQIKSNIKIHNDFIYELEPNKYKTIPNGYNNEININELYIQGKISENIDISLGRQIVPWGKSDAIRILDVLNNTDNRKIGLIDIKDLKLGRSMSKIDYFMDKWSFSTIILHENRFSKKPQQGSDYAPPKPKNEITPSNKQAIAISLLGNLEGYDIGFYYTKQYMDNQNYYSDMLGFSYAKVINSFLIKTDMAYFDKLNIAGGLEYSGFKNRTISLEVALKKEIMNYYIRWTREFLNKSLKYTKSIYAIENKKNIILRGVLEYAINDELSAKLGYINYMGDKMPLKLLENNDRFFGEIKGSF